MNGFLLVFDEVAFQHVLIVQSIASYSPGPEQFGVLNQSLFQRFKEPHDFGICFGDNVVCGVCFQPVVFRFTLRFECFFVRRVGVELDLRAIPDFSAEAACFFLKR